VVFIQFVEEEMKDRLKVILMLVSFPFCLIAALITAPFYKQPKDD